MRGADIRYTALESLEFASMEPIDDLAIARMELYRRVRDSVYAWAAQHDSVLHLLSADLDSSIVLSSLVSAPTTPRVTCLSLHYWGRGDNEREYAGICAPRFNRPLLEKARDVDVDFKSLTTIHRSAAPDNYLFYLEEAVQARIAVEQGATAVTSGWGGEQLFYSSSGGVSAAEYVERRGLTRGWLRVALAAARLGQVSLWGVLDKTARQLLTSRRWRVRDEAERFKELVPSEVVAHVAKDGRSVHPWFRSVPRGFQSKELGMRIC